MGEKEMERENDRKRVTFELTGIVADWPVLNSSCHSLAY